VSTVRVGLQYIHYFIKVILQDIGVVLASFFKGALCYIYEEWSGEAGRCEVE